MSGKRPVTKGKESKLSKLKEIRVAELFAGVGGFRIGLEGHGKEKKKGYKVVWSNQWEPSTKRQHANEVYTTRFGHESHSGIDLNLVPTDQIPDHDLLVGGFPCQDYSVAKTLSSSQGIIGKKGVLWWQIHRILKEKGKKAPQFLMLENVDRLLKSPVTQRGRDFAIMIASLNDLGYVVEWRVINAADYGMPQRRRRVFMLGYKKGLPIEKRIRTDSIKWILQTGTIASAFPVEKTIVMNEFEIEGELDEVTKTFNKEKKDSPFLECGIAIDRKVRTFKPKPTHDGPFTTLGDVLEKDEKLIPKEYFISEEKIESWTYLKGAKREERTSKTGFTFFYSEGGMVFPDALDKPSRTIITGEGGSSPSRFKHVVKMGSGKLRRLMPVELERLCMFPDGHTEGQPDVRRAFFMGNALVVGIIDKLGRSLHKQVNKD
jgi:DNA (cytosine-5)-methyltransferase 1